MVNGYRITDIGKIPCDWEIKKLRDCTKKNLTYGINAPSVNYDSKLPQYIRITDITDDGYYNETNRVSVDNEDADRYVVHEGDILLARTGASTGKSYLYRVEDGRLVYAGFLISASIDRDKADERFIFAQLHTERYWKWVESTSQRSGQPGINGKEYGEYLLAFPKKAEQTSIANAISDIENLISTQEALIAKKQAIKQGAKQELLTGKRRLAKFKQGQKFQNTEVGRIPFDWKVLSLKECCVGSLHYGVNAPAIPYDEKYPCYVRITDITDEGKYSNSDRVSVRVGFDSEFILKENDICLARTGASTGKSYLYNILDGTMVYAGFLICASIDSTIANADYIFNQLHTNRYWSWVKAVSQRSGQPGINGREYGDLLLPMPSLEEQIEIAEVLQDMDREIVNQQAKLEKLRRIKSGMMDKLLTGKIRLTD